jgi:hypothetical protein
MNNEDARYYRDLLLNKTTDADEFYVSKFNALGNVRPDWSNAAWLKERTAAWIKRPSKDCHTMLSH